jgi:hypothetical protein
VADYQWVLPRISVGTALNASDMPGVQADGIGYIVDATLHDDNPFAGADGIEVLYLDINDDGQSKHDVFKNVVAPWFMAHWFVSPAKRFNFHCDAGINRGPSTCFFCLLLLGLPASDAEDFIRHVRPQVGLAYKADAMAVARELGYLVS